LDIPNLPFTFVENINMAKFAKLFDISKDSQVIIILEESDNSKIPYSFKVITEHLGVIVCATSSFKDEVRCLEEFEKYDFEQANEFFSEAIAIIEED